MRRGLIAAVVLIPIIGASCARVDETSSGAGSGPVQIGLLLDVTGPGATLGEQERNGAEIAVEHINDAGGINGRRVELTFADSQSKPDVAAAQARQLLDEGVLAIIGTSIASTCGAVKPLTEARKVVQYCMSGADVGTGPYFYAASFDPLLYLGQLPSRWMRSRGLTRAACLATADKSGQDYDRLFRAAAGGNGVQVVSTEQFAPGDTNVDTQMTNIRAANPDVLYACVTGANIVPVVKAVAAQGLTVPVWAGTGATSLATAELVQGDLPPGGLFSMGVWIQVPDQIPADLPNGDAIKQFAQTYRTKHGEQPDWPAAAGYDVTRLIASSIQQGAANADQVTAKLQSTRNYQGLLSNYTFTPNDHRGTTPPPIVLRFTSNGGFQVAGQVEVGPQR